MPRSCAKSICRAGTVCRWSQLQPADCGQRQTEAFRTCFRHRSGVQRNCGSTLSARCAHHHLKASSASASCSSTDTEPYNLILQVHGHYADAGEVAALVASTMASTEACDMVMTGHSLGRNKLEHLLSSGGW
jgi:hypothetical protein